MTEDELEFRIELAKIQLKVLQTELNMLELKLSIAQAEYGTP